MAKTALSFYLDDTGPYNVPANTFKTFLDFVSSEGIAGESSLILGGGWKSHGLLSRPASDLEHDYVAQVRRAFDCGIDTHMELMTHGGLYDFERDCVPEGAAHEGVWLHEPEVALPVYEAYFGSIIAEAEKIGVQFTGVTWPGCSCEACGPRYAELRESESFGVNPNVWQALLNLAKRGKFRGRTVPCFTLNTPDVAPLKPVAAEGECGVYDLLPNARDRFGIWDNDPAHVEANYYITADGESGRIVELVRSQAPYCLFYAHWQGLNPATGVGWDAFTQVVERVQRFLGDEVVWVRPSELTDGLQQGKVSSDT